VKGINNFPEKRENRKIPTNPIAARIELDIIKGMQRSISNAMANAYSLSN